MSDTIKSFYVKNPETIPPKASDSACLAHNVSDWYMCKIEGLTGGIYHAIVAYDFTRGEWMAIQAGMKRLIEYYVEVSDQNAP